VTRILVISLIINRPNFTHFMHPGKSGQKFSTIWTVLNTVNQSLLVGLLVNNY